MKTQMEDYTKIRNRTRELLRGGTPSELNFQEALPLCQQLWLAFPETFNLWDAHQYAHCLKCLKKIDEAENVCECVLNNYNRELLEKQAKALNYIEVLYAWIIYDKYVRPLNVGDNNVPSCVIVEKVALLFELINQNERNAPSLTYCVLKTTGHLLKNDPTFTDYSSLITLLDKLDSEQLSTSANSFVDSTGKERETASDKEKYYQLKSALFLKLKKYEECIECCNKAIETIGEFHYNNELWFARKITIALDKLGRVESAVKLLKQLVIKNDNWFLFYELGKLYQELGDYKNAKIYMLRAACTKDPEQMKVKLFESLGDLFEKEGDSNSAQVNYLFVRKILVEKGWPVKKQLTDKIRLEQNVSLKLVRQLWLSKLYDLMGNKQGEIVKLLPNHKDGFIKADTSYYFQSKNFLDAREFLKVGSKVSFVVMNSFDKKKQKDSQEAVAIKLLN